MDEIPSKIIDLLIDLVKSHPIWTVINGIVLLVIFLAAKPKNSNNNAPLVVGLFMAWPISIAFTAAVFEYFSMQQASFRQRFREFFIISIQQPQLTFSYVAGSFAVVIMLSTAGLLWIFGRDFSLIFKTIRENILFFVAVVGVGIFLGFYFATLHVEAINAVSVP